MGDGREEMEIELDFQEKKSFCQGGESETENKVSGGFRDEINLKKWRAGGSRRQQEAGLQQRWNKRRRRRREKRREENENGKINNKKKSRGLKRNVKI